VVTVVIMKVSEQIGSDTRIMPLNTVCNVEQRQLANVNILTNVDNALPWVWFVMHYTTACAI